MENVIGPKADETSSLKIVRDQHISYSANMGRMFVYGVKQLPMLMLGFFYCLINA